MKYRIIDLQITGREFADGAVFESREEVLDQLTSFHCEDAEEPEFIMEMTLEEILDYGGWSLEEIKTN